MLLSHHISIEKKLSQEILRRLQESQQSSSLTEDAIRQQCCDWFTQQSYVLPTYIRDEIIQTALHTLIGLGPLEVLLKDPSVTEIMVNGAQNIFFEKEGKLEKSNLCFRDDEHLLRIINRIVGTVGRRIDQRHPLVDARLADGSRVNAIIAPLSLCGPVLTIRKFPKKIFTCKDLEYYDSASPKMVRYLQKAIENKKNILISGGTGAGKTSTLNACATCIPFNERIITIEDVAEIRIDHPHHIVLESRMENIEGTGAIPIRTLLKNALRMRPDRIIVGEIRGEEVVDMLQAMNTGHKGSLSTLHANTPLESLYRLEAMVLMEGDIPLESVRPQIVQALDIIVQQDRLQDGRRKITCISELTKSSDKDFLLKEVFGYDQEKDAFYQPKQ